jgi:arylsulfatase A-like enzyme/Flp pilus assembly protein TadD
MKKQLTFILLVSIFIGFSGCGGNTEESTPNKPITPFTFAKKEYNVLLITLDTFRRDRMSVYSDKYLKTPNIERLASRSIVFDRAYAHNPITLPSHVNIMTGTTPRFHGVSDNTGFRLDDRFLTLAEHVKQQGYSTGAFIGSFPLDSRFGLNQGFDHYDDNYGTHNVMELFFVERKAEKVIAPAIEWIEGCQGKWFAWIHIFDAHQVYLPPPPYDTQYSQDLYSGEAAYIDASLQKLFRFLEQQKRMEDTVIILTADHGEALGEKGEETHAYFAYNNTIHVPLILYIPGAGTRQVRENVAHVDIFPTVCELLSIEAPQHLQGESLLPIIAGHKRKQPDIYFESLTSFLNRGWAPLRGFIRGDTKFIDQPIPEVFNVADDPNENNNLAETANVTQMKRDLAKLKRDLKGSYMMQRTKKLNGDVQKKLKSLGYLSSAPASTPKVFTAAHDLKTLLPLQNKMELAVWKFQNGNPDIAIVELKQVVEASPQFVLVYRHMANIYKDTGQLPKAIQILEAGLKKNPGSINLLSKLGIMLVEANRPGEAIDILDVCIKKDPFDPENFNYLGVAYYRKGNFKAALDYYKKALEIDNNYASVFNNIGSLYLVVYLKQKEEGAYQEALRNFSKALEIDPRLFAAYNGRGAAYKFKNRIDEAISDWKQAIQIKPDFIDAYFNLAVSFMQSGDNASALKYLQTLKDRFLSKLPPGTRQRLTRLISEASR